MAAKKKLPVKRKKRWFTVVAPDVYRGIELAQVIAYEPGQLIGKSVELTLMSISGLPKDQAKKLTFKIIESKGEKVLAAPWKLYLNNSYIQRASRRYKERFISVLNITAKDGKTLKLKLIALILRRLHQRVRAALLKKMEEKVKETLTAQPSTALFVPGAVERLVIDLKKILKSIYPVDRLLVWKVTIA